MITQEIVKQVIAGTPDGRVFRINILEQSAGGYSFFIEERVEGVLMVWKSGICTDSEAMNFEKGKDAKFWIDTGNRGNGSGSVDGTLQSALNSLWK